MREAELLVNPLTYEIMSGEFRPLCDPEGRAHTLGRLVIAVFQKGDEIHSGIFTYTPSWATNVEIVAQLETEEIRKDAFEFRGVELNAAYDRKISLFKTDPGSSQSLLISNCGRTAPVSLVMGLKLERARLSLAQEVQDFFDGN